MSVVYKRDYWYHLKERDNVLHAAKREDSSVLWNTYKSFKNRVTHLMKDQKKEYYSNLILRNHNDSKKIWKCLKDIIPKSPDIVPHMINVNGAPDLLQTTQVLPKLLMNSSSRMQQR